MPIEVKRGGRAEYPCESCGGTIDKGEPHFRTGGKGGFKRYHSRCVPVKGKVGEGTTEPTKE